MRYTADQARLLLEDIEQVVGPHRRAVAAGGWTRMASVRAAKADAIKAVSFSPVVQPGVTGAALLAAFAVDGDGLPLADFIRASSAADGRSEDTLRRNEMTHAAKVRTGTLDDIATDSHVFSIIAMDQRNTLRRMFTAVGPRGERR